MGLAQGEAPLVSATRRLSRSAAEGGWPDAEKRRVGGVSGAGRRLAYYGPMANGLTYLRNTTTPEATKQLASTLAPYLRAGDVVVLNGDLGAGKTQFVQGVAAALGVRAAVTSPTFNILLEYHEGALPLYHFDLYRLDEPSQLDDIDYFGVIDGDGASFVEWAEKFPDELPYDYLEITITADERGTRRIVAHSYGSRSRQLLCVWANDSKARLGKTQL